MYLKRRPKLDLSRPLQGYFLDELGRRSSIILGGAPWLKDASSATHSGPSSPRQDA